jgi:hypothetical protein
MRAKYRRCARRCAQRRKLRPAIGRDETKGLLREPTGNEKGVRSRKARRCARCSGLITPFTLTASPANRPRSPMPDGSGSRPSCSSPAQSSTTSPGSADTASSDEPLRHRGPRASPAKARRRRRPLIHSRRPHLRSAVDRHVVLSAVETPDQAVNLVAGFPAEPPYSANDCLGSLLVKLGAASTEPAQQAARLTTTKIRTLHLQARTGCLVL